MCDTCGCGNPDNKVRIIKPDEENQENDTHEYFHSHNIPHSHEHNHSHEEHNHSDLSSPNRLINLEIDILQKNNLLAERNRGFFEAKNILAINLVSSPGSGKTSILERTIKEFDNQQPIFVIEGDQQTTNDSRRIEALNTPVVQINTGNGCHLDAEMINNAVKKLNPSENSILFIENVGNLVCPAMFDLGESFRVIIISVTEGEDKPLKYPNMFETSNLCLINKTDLLPYIDYQIEQLKEYALRVNHNLEFIELSAKTGHGISNWTDWLISHKNY